MSDWQDKGTEILRLEEQSLSYLARESARPANPYSPATSAEIARRVAQAQIDSAEAQKRAVENAKWSVFWLEWQACRLCFKC